MCHTSSLSPALAWGPAFIYCFTSLPTGLVFFSRKIFYTRGNTVYILYGVLTSKWQWDSLNSPLPLVHQDPCPSEISQSSNCREGSVCRSDGGAGAWLEVVQPGWYVRLHFFTRSHRINVNIHMCYSIHTVHSTIENNIMLFQWYLARFLCAFSGGEGKTGKVTAVKNWRRESYVRTYMYVYFSLYLVAACMCLHVRTWCMYIQLWHANNTMYSVQDALLYTDVICTWADSLRSLLLGLLVWWLSCTLSFVGCLFNAHLYVDCPTQTK